MAVLTAKTRAKLPTNSFALPGRRFPVHDKVHARVAKSYASRMVKRGQLSSAQAAKVNAAANRRLAMQYGGTISLGGKPMKLGPRQFVSPKARAVLASAKGGKLSQPVMLINRMKMQNGGTTLGNSGRTKKRMRMRMRYAAGGAVSPVGYEGMRGQMRLRGNPTHSGGFPRFEGDGEGG